MLRSVVWPIKRRGADVVQDFDHGVFRVDHAGVDDGVHLDGDVVARDDFPGWAFEDEPQP
jgi:hypothetical protein